MPLRGLFASLFAAALLLGCATMSPKECAVANWSDVGLRDGLSGAALGVLDSRVKDCAEAHVAVDMPAYLKGREQGLVGYCRADNAVRQGLEGRPYAGVCPAEIDPEFRRRWRIGTEVYRAHSQLAQLESDRRQYERRLYESKSDSERNYLRNLLWDLDGRFANARNRLREAEFLLGQLR